MIRVGSSSTGVSSLLNSFHSASSFRDGLYTNATGATPPPVVRNWLGTDTTGEVPPNFTYSAGTTYYLSTEDLVVGQKVSTFYLNFVAYGGTVSWDITFNNAYSGTVGSVFSESCTSNLRSIADFYVRIPGSRTDFDVYTGSGRLVILGFASKGYPKESTSRPGEFELTGLNKKSYASQILSSYRSPSQDVQLSLQLVSDRDDLFTSTQFFIKNPAKVTVSASQMKTYLFP